MFLYELYNISYYYTYIIIYMYKYLISYIIYYLLYNILYNSDAAKYENLYIRAYSLSQEKIPYINRYVTENIQHQ